VSRASSSSPESSPSNWIKSTPLYLNAMPVDMRLAERQSAALTALGG
jgi:hypothetical protein